MVKYSISYQVVHVDGRWDRGTCQIEHDAIRAYADITHVTKCVLDNLKKSDPSARAVKIMNWQKFEDDEIIGGGA